MAHLYNYVPELAGRSIPLAGRKPAQVLRVNWWRDKWELVVKHETLSGSEANFYYYLDPLTNLTGKWGWLHLDFRPILLQIHRRHQLRPYLNILAVVLPPDLVRYLNQAL